MCDCSELKQEIAELRRGLEWLTLQLFVTFSRARIECDLMEEVGRILVDDARANGQPGDMRVSLFLTLLFRNHRFWDLSPTLQLEAVHQQMGGTFPRVLAPDTDDEWGAYELFLRSEATKRRKAAASRKKN